MKDFCNLYRLTSLKNKLNCYKNPANPLCTGLILSNCSKYFQSAAVIKTRLSDFHKMDVTIMQTNICRLEPKILYQRNFKNFTNELFRENLVNQLQVTEANTNDKASKMFFKMR